MSEVMHFPDTLDEAIRALWVRNSKLAAQHGETLVPEDFARMFVDENLTER